MTSAAHSRRVAPPPGPNRAISLFQALHSRWPRPRNGPPNELRVDAEADAYSAVGHSEFAEMGGAFGDLLVPRRGSGAGEIDDQRKLSSGSNSLRPGPQVL